MTPRASLPILAVCFLWLSGDLDAAQDYFVHTGQVLHGDVLVPGATVTISRDRLLFTTVTNERGLYRFSGLAGGVWTLHVRMTGFITVDRDIVVEAGAPPSTWRIVLLSTAELGAGLVGHEDLASEPYSSGADGSASGVSDALVVTGSLHQGLVSQVAQPRAFGNNRPGARDVYTGAVTILGGHSAWDARPFSFLGHPTQQPTYADRDLTATLGGPFLGGGVFFARGWQSVTTRASTRLARVPTLLERQGNFSRNFDGSASLVDITDPSTGRPFDGMTIPQDRVSSQAQALLSYYPTPNLDSGGLYNYQAPVTTTVRRSGVRLRLSQALDSRNAIAGEFSYSRTTTADTTLFGFEPLTQGSDLDASFRWSFQAPRQLWLRILYRVNRRSTRVNPHFANVTNVSADAGIAGTSQDPANWGPPTLRFSSGVATLTDVQYRSPRDLEQFWSVEAGLFSRRRHTITFGAGFSRYRADRFSQQDARGQFLFTGDATGSDLADFLLGIPQAASLSLGNADRYFSAPSYHAYVSDDWRITRSLTVTGGVRWEYEVPWVERFNRLANLDVASGFSSADSVVADNPLGLVTGRRYPSSLLRPDRLGFQPRVGLAWRPNPKLPLIVRASYGVYRSAAIYESLATLLAYQPPLSSTLNIERNEVFPLTLATGFTLASEDAPPTFAVDPDLRVARAQNWTASVQIDVPWALTLTTSYMGTNGSRLMRQFLPNTHPPGATNACPSCPVGFLYVTSDGGSSRHAGQIALRRRLRQGLAASVEYTFAKAVDDGVTFTGPRLDGAATAQDWLDLDAEHGPSSFDQRHLVTMEFQYSLGGRTGRWDGIISHMLNGWTITGSLTPRNIIR